MTVHRSHAQEANAVTPIDPAVAVLILPAILGFASFWVVFG